MIRSQWQDELFADTSFVGLYRHAKRYVVATDNLVVAAIVAFGLLGIYGEASQGSSTGGISEVSASALRSLVSIGLTYSSSILGFLVSGFALFFAITKSEVLVLLAKIDHTDKSISRLRFVLLSFMFVFAHYLAFLLVSVILSVLIAPHGVLALLFRGWIAESAKCANLVAVLGIAAVGGWLTYLVMLLKSFVWNLYQTVLIAITVGDDLQSGRLDPLLRVGPGDAGAKHVETEQDK